MAAKKTARKKTASKKSGSPAMNFIVAALKKNKNAAYADIKAAADKKKLAVYPIMFGRAKLLLGHVKAGSAKKKKAAKRSPGRPRKAADSPLDAVRDLLGSIKDTERENAHLRATLEKVADLINRAL